MEKRELSERAQVQAERELVAERRPARGGALYLVTTARNHRANDPEHLEG